MEKETEQFLIEKTEEAIKLLEMATSKLLTENSDAKKKYQIGKIGRAVGLIREFQKPIFEDNTDLKQLPPDYVPVPPMTKEEVEAVKGLSNAQIQNIDALLKSKASHRWLKVARIIFDTERSLELENHDIPLAFYVERIGGIVDKGVFESQGDITYIRYSEIRIPPK